MYNLFAGVVEPAQKNFKIMATYYIKKDTKDEYYWILKSNNCETVCKSSESYTSKENAKKSLRWNQANAKTDDVVDTTI